MIYTIITSREADENIAYLKKSEINAYNKVMQLFDELRKHPRFGTGKPELLKHGQFKKSLPLKHLEYSIACKFSSR